MTKRNPTPEKAFQDTVDGLLRMFGCVTKHDYPLLTKHGVYRTGTTLRGWPDLFAFHPRRWVLAIEVKAEHGVLDPEQLACLSLFAEIPCARAWVVSPVDPEWTDLQGWVRRPRDAPRVYGFEPAENPRRALVEAQEWRAQRRAEARLRRPSGRGSRGRRRDTLPGL